MSVTTVPRAPAPAETSAEIPADLLPLIMVAAEAHGLDPALLAAVARAESGFDTRARSPLGAEGLMQFLPGRARELGIADPYDPAESLDAGARHLRAQLDAFGDLSLALAAYETGPEVVLRHGGVPAYSEIRAFVARVIADHADLRAPEAGSITDRKGWC
jgi:soluble lytic murein transglycosylase-like protein